jgi:hypothetical protein
MYMYIHIYTCIGALLGDCEPDLASTSKGYYNKYTSNIALLDLSESNDSSSNTTPDKSVHDESYYYDLASTYNGYNSKNTSNIALLDISESNNCSNVTPNKGKCFEFLYSLLMSYWLGLCVLRRSYRQII